jgi:DNA-binding transcriptional LysR family regulator
MSLSDIDLNLLVYLDALLEEQHVTNASKRVGLSQSAMSRALSRLRELFDDELLVKTTHGMAPSPLALRLAPEVRRILRDVERAITGVDSFDPGSDRRTLRVVADDTCQLLLIPALLEQVAKQAPTIAVEVSSRGLQIPRGALEQGQVDLVLGRAPMEEPALRSRELLRDDLVLLAPRRTTERLDLADFIDAKHVDVQHPTQSASAIDIALKQVGKRRDVAFKVAHIATLPDVIRRTGAIATLPARVAALLEAEDLQILPSPLQLPGVILAMSWHMRSDEDGGNEWLRGLLEEQARTLRERS